MAKTISRVLLVTANVGSIFEDPEKMLSIWLREFLAVVTKLEPELLAIHCQEVGGKNYEESMQHVNKFITLLLDSKEMAEFDRARVFLDEDFTAVEKFTALGSLYFVHQSVKVVEIFDFHSNKFVSVEGKELLTGNIEHVRIKEKAKFAKEFFPDFVWSRKGFIRTRWNLYNTKFDLVNIHLIHDVSNVAAMETSPSPYSKYRERALIHTIERFETDNYEKYPFFIFGDFNFRMDTHNLIKHMTDKLEEQRIMGGKKNELSKVLYKQSDNGNVVLTVGKKDFSFTNHNQLFSSNNSMTLQQFDQEPFSCRSKLFEYPVTFPPSYPFSENTEDGTSYMPTRCPGWCDRIMMSHDAVNLIENNAAQEYRMMGSNICMGDHKPIYLNLKIRHPPYTPSTLTGNTDIDPMNSDSALASNINPSTDNARQASEIGSLRNFISINGETIEATSLDKINIHDNATFVNEEILSNVFIGNLKRRSIDGNVERGDSVVSPSVLRFRGAVQSLVKSDAVMKMMKHFSHRSDSESDSDAEDLPPVDDVRATAELSTSSAATALDLTTRQMTQATIEDANTNNNNNNNTRNERSIAPDSVMPVAAVQLAASSPKNAVNDGNIGAEDRAAGGDEHQSQGPPVCIDSPKTAISPPPGGYEISRNPHAANGGEARVEKSRVNLDNSLSSSTSVISPPLVQAVDKDKSASAASNKTTTVSTTQNTTSRRMECTGCCDIQ